MKENNMIVLLSIIVYLIIGFLFLKFFYTDGNGQRLGKAESLGVILGWSVFVVVIIFFGIFLSTLLDRKILKKLKGDKRNV